MHSLEVIIALHTIVGRSSRKSITAFSMSNSDYLELDTSTWRKQPSELARVGSPEVRRKSLEDLLSWEAPKIDKLFWDVENCVANLVTLDALSNWL